MITDNDIEKMKKVFATKEELISMKSELSSLKIQLILLTKRVQALEIRMGRLEKRIDRLEKRMEEGFAGVMKFLGEMYVDLKKELNTNSGKVIILEKDVDSLKSYKTMTDNHEVRIIKIENQLVT